LMCNAQMIDPIVLAEYAQMRPSYSVGVSNWGASGATSIALATAAIDQGLANVVMCVFGGSRDFEAAGNAGRVGGGPASMPTEWEAIYGPAAGAGTGYGLIKQRHMYRYGSRDE